MQRTTSHTTAVQSDIKVKDRLPSKELRERLGADDSLVTTAK